MVGFTFVYGVDGFGADVAPAYEEGFYLDFNKAFKKQMDLNKDIFEEEGGFEYCIYDKPTDEVECYTIKKLDEACIRLNTYNEPPIGWYQLVKIEIIE